MKSARFTGAAVLFLTLGCALSSSAQQAQPLQPLQIADNPGVGLIPTDHYRAHFGPQHKFHLSPAAYGLDRRFQYGGYSFGFVDQWPTNWLPAEDLFVTQIEGAYYLCNHRYPGVTIPLSVASPANRSSITRPTPTRPSPTRTPRDASIRPSSTRAPKASRAKALAPVATKAG